ncbi:MAG: prepilin-type N-terminal cleavage/methylation domain-containing protein [Gammaproteobacteria bacterium]
MTTARDLQRGFTLIEVMVAFAIFALSVGAIYEAFAGATRRAAQARERELDWLVGQSLLTDLRLKTPPWEAEQAGTAPSGHKWRITVSPFNAGTDERGPWKAYAVSVSVGAREGGYRTTLESVEIARLAP